MSAPAGETAAPAGREHPGPPGANPPEHPGPPGANPPGHPTNPPEHPTNRPEHAGMPAAPPGFAVIVGALLRKELRIELRTLESVPGMSLFAVTVFVLFHFGLDKNAVSGDEAAGILWVTLLLAAVLGINRLFVADAEEGGFDGFLLAPVDRGALFVAKAFALLIYLIALELVAVPAFALLLLGPSLGPALPQLPAALLLGDLGVAVIGTLVAALAARTRARDLLGALLALPLLVPVVIGGARASAPLLAAHSSGPAARWLATLGLYDLVFGLIAYAVFDFLLED
jgi:heme exporter protein B